MTLAADIAADSAVFDATETVTFQARNDDQTANGAAVTNVTALAEPLNRQTLQRFESVGLQPTDLVFSLWGLSAEPKHGDTITRSDGVVWTVLAAAKETLATRWRCPCRRQV